MKYIQTIFENESVQNLAVANEDLIQFATDALVTYNVALEESINSNLEAYVIEGDLVATYENIRNAAIQENISFMNFCAEVLRSDKSDEEKVEEITAVIESSWAGVKSSVTSAMEKGKKFASEKARGMKHKAGNVAAAVGGVGEKSTPTTYGSVKVDKSGKTFSREELISKGKKRLGAAGAGLGAMGAAAAGSKAYTDAQDAERNKKVAASAGAAALGGALYAASKKKKSEK